MSTNCSSTNPTTANVNFDINQNATFEYPFQLLESGSSVPTNIVSWSFSASIKRMFTDAVPLMFFTASITDATQSIVTIRLTPNQTTQLTGSRYVYDITATDMSESPDVVYRLAQGKIKVYLGSTYPTVTE